MSSSEYKHADCCTEHQQCGKSDDDATGCRTGLIEHFPSVKGALDFLGDISEVSLNIIHESNGKELELDMPSRFILHRPQHRTTMHIE